MVAPFVVGLAVAAAAYAGRHGIHAWQAFKARPPTAGMRKFYEEGFQPKMTRREAALILGVRESTSLDKVKEAHRRVVVANHPDAGGSHYLACKINEAKDLMLGKAKSSSSPFCAMRNSQNLTSSLKCSGCVHFSQNIAPMKDSRV